MKITQKRAMPILKQVGAWLVGVAGSNAALGMVKNYIPENAKKWTPALAVAAGLYGMLEAKGMLQHIFQGVTLFSVINLIGQLIPADSPIKAYIPTLQGFGATNTPLQFGSVKMEYLPPPSQSYYELPEYQTSFAGSSLAGANDPYVEKHLEAQWGG